jgi:hypothetical protein
LRESKETPKGAACPVEPAEESIAPPAASLDARNARAERTQQPTETKQPTPAPPAAKLTSAPRSEGHNQPVPALQSKVAVDSPGRLKNGD